MTTISETRVGEQVTLPDHMRVVLTSRGVSIPKVTRADDVHLDPWACRLLVHLAGGAVPSEAVESVTAAGAPDPTALDALVATLRDRSLLVPQAARSAERRAEPPAHDGTMPLEEHLAMSTPVVLRVGPDGFDYLDHDAGLRARLQPDELFAATAIARRPRRTGALRNQEKYLAERALTESAFDDLSRRLIHAGMLRTLTPDEAERSAETGAGREFRRIFQLAKTVDEDVERHVEAERRREQRTGVTRTRVVPVQHNGTLAPLALGMIFAFAREFDGGRLLEHYDFRPDWVTSPERLEAVTETPGIFLFSNYHWSHSENLAASQRIKELSPNSITVHGGPDTPKYEGDAHRYFASNPHIDVAVRGEGEITTAELLDRLIGRLSGDPVDLDVLHDVAGLSYRTDAGVVRTDDRDRIADLDIIPSPYLTGLFDSYAETTAPTAIIETNRGCPYKCTYCDWGSATASRIRKFSLERVIAEFEWCAKNQVPHIFLADANFGIFERDVEIAEKVAELKKQYGYPKSFVTNYAKNTVKHLKRIVEVMVEAGIFTEGLLSLQSMDEDTLDTIERSNIKLERYEDLAREFRRAGLPLYVDVMLGLPGSTRQSFANDLQQCIDREVTAKVFLTELLVNSPMNDPEYRGQHAISTADDEHGVYATKAATQGSVSRALVISTATFTREDYEEMKQLRRVFLLCENYGVLRQLARFVRSETGMREVAFYEQLRSDGRLEPTRWPEIAFITHAIPDLMAPPLSWRYAVDELHRYAVERLELADDGALETVLAVQAALLPSRGRQFPIELQLRHDWAGWYQLMYDAKQAGHLTDWETVVPRLSEMRPGTFSVTDPNDISGSGLGRSLDQDAYGTWELASPVSRPTPPRHLL